MAVFFYFLYLEPIFIHSPHFKEMKAKYKKTFNGLVITSWITGVNFIRLIYCSVFGTESTSTELHTHYFFVKPLNTVANITMVFNGIDVIAAIIVIFEYQVGRDAWALAIFTMIGNAVLCLFQLAKIFQMRKFMTQYQPISS